MTKVAIAGGGGRMGRMLVETALQADDVELAAVFDRPGSACIGRDAGELVAQPCGVVMTADVDAAVSAVDCVIDFTLPAGTLVHLDAARRHGKAMVIGTTGFDTAQKARIATAAETIPVVFAPNMAIGVNAVFKLLEVAARILDEGYDVEIIETHHRLKVDAPSGTALRMGEIVAHELGRDLEACAIYGREGVTGKRKDDTIGFSTVRGGDVIGDHTVLFAGIGERIEITHKSANRMHYALGALRAARFLATRDRGLFDMQDVLGLR